VSARYLLDTNIVSDLVRHPQGRVAAKIAEVGEDAVATSIIVAAELRYGAVKKPLPGCPPNLKPSWALWRLSHWKGRRMQATGLQCGVGGCRHAEWGE
jgi:predicted nucleic acid-binding protein